MTFQCGRWLLIQGAHGESPLSSLYKQRHSTERYHRVVAYVHCRLAGSVEEAKQIEPGKLDVEKLRCVALQSSEKK